MRSSRGTSSYLVPGLISLLLHGLVILIFAWGWGAEKEPERKVRPNYVPAKLVELTPKSVEKPAAAKPKPKKVDLTKKRQEQERLQKLEAEKRAAAQAKQKREQAAKDEQARKQKEQAQREKLAAEQAAREKAAAEQAAAEQRQREAEMAEQLEAEENRIAAAEQEQQAQSYIALIAQRIEQNWSRPPSARNGMKCELLMQLVPTGRVVNVSVVKSSGNLAFDRSAEQAVKKVEQFVELKNMPPEVFERYFRQLRLVFNPQDLRL